MFSGMKNKVLIRVEYPGGRVREFREPREHLKTVAGRRTVLFTGSGFVIFPLNSSIKVHRCSHS